MEISPIQPYAWDILLNPPMFLPYYYYIPENYVHWKETPNSHIYSADIPGVRKEKIKVEVEDSRYLIILTEVTSEPGNEDGDGDQMNPPMRRFMRKFRLPRRVDIDGISVGYENGVLTITVPRRGFYIDPADLNVTLQEATARAA